MSHHACLFHGNADVERSLSINKKILTPERTLLSDAALNDLRLTRDAVSLHGNVTSVPITRKTITCVQGSYKKYQERLEEEISQAELLKRKKHAEVKDQEKYRGEERRRKLSQKEIEVKMNEKQLQEDLNHANSLFEEANKRLINDIKEKTFSEINIADVLLEVAKKNVNKCRQQRQGIDVKSRKLLESVPSLNERERKESVVLLY